VFHLIIGVVLSRRDYLWKREIDRAQIAAKTLEMEYPWSAPVLGRGHVPFKTGVYNVTVLTAGVAAPENGRAPNESSIPMFYQ